MDLADCWRDSAPGRWLSSRLPTLSRGSADSERTFRFRRKLIGITLVLAAAALAFWAQNLARVSAIRDWERTHGPGEKVWNSALGARGFAPVRDPRLLQKDSRKLPMRLDSEGSIWISPDSEWITIFSNPDQTLPIAIYCWDCAHPPSDWESLGDGWEAFDSALQRIDRVLGGRQKEILSKKSVKIIDPREILY